MDGQFGWSLYLHIPFCATRCTYCAFNTYTDRHVLLDDYVRALCSEIASFGALNRSIHTIYLGGGTPSLLRPFQLEQIISHVLINFTYSPILEITQELNPRDATKEYLHAIRQYVSRISLGMQSVNSSELQMFSRDHEHSHVVQAMKYARAAGFDNINLDLIYGTPCQTIDMWRDSVQAALDLNPDHLSAYALSLENGTELKRRVTYKELPLPDPDLAADMYELASEMMEKAGFIQYEISNWAKPGKECLHNIQYWKNLPYLGMGAGAHGYVNQTRTVNVMKPEIYIERLKNPPPNPLPFPQTPATMTTDPIDRQTDMFETVFMGLRLLNEGLSLTAFEQRYGEKLEIKFADEIRRLTRMGLLWQDGDALKLTKSARLISNRVFQEFATFADEEEA
ncbi:MAG: radical SAM family heme chaperone HemW [Anaerolineae bacterium]|nr:radical SAM family heme chaperone HemW [Anaerolineae bacterium]